jgi:hypothetical protein
MKRPRRAATLTEAEEADISPEPALGSDSDCEVFVPAAKRRVHGRQHQQTQQTAAAAGSPGKQQQQQQERQAPAAEPAAAEVLNPAAAAAAAGSKEAMTLVLFDEADSLLDTDKGFLAALPGLIRESRRPIVLCLNDSQLPQALTGVATGVQVQQAMLLRPHGEELLRLLVLVLAAEERQDVGLDQVLEVMAAHVSFRFGFLWWLFVGPSCASGEV